MSKFHFPLYRRDIIKPKNSLCAFRVQLIVLDGSQPWLELLGSISSKYLTVLLRSFSFPPRRQKARGGTQARGGGRKFITSSLMRLDKRPVGRSPLLCLKSDGNPYVLRLEKSSRRTRFRGTCGDGFTYLQIFRNWRT